MMSIKLTEGVEFSRIKEQGLLVDTASGVYFELNVTAAEMMEIMLAVNQSGDALAQLQAKFDVDDDILQRDLGNLLNDLQNFNLIQVQA
ncbi:MAG: PqqD family protein [Gemmatimonadetes bacterium]|nr:PqqD family protein [Gemmatimonadota bacterium]